MNETISPDAETGLRADQVAQKRAGAAERPS